MSADLEADALGLGEASADSDEGSEAAAGGSAYVDDSNSGVHALSTQGTDAKGLKAKNEDGDDATSSEAPDSQEDHNATGPRRTVDAATFADDLIRELKRQNPPLVPRAANLRTVLGLPDDVLLVRTADLVRKAMDELALGLHWHLLYTLVHSAWQAHLFSNLGLSTLRFRGKPAKQPGNQPRRAKRIRYPEIELRVRSDADGVLRLEGLDAFFNVRSLDFRALLNHVVRVNTTRRGVWTFHRKRGTGTYYPENVVRSAQLLGNCANFFSHRNAVVPRTVSPAPGDAASDFAAIKERELQVSTAFFTAVASWTASLEAKIHKLKAMHAPDRTADQLYAHDKDWLHGLCRSMLDVSCTHLRAADSIRLLFLKMISVPRSAEDTPSAVDALRSLSSRLEHLDEEDELADEDTESVARTDAKGDRLREKAENNPVQGAPHSSIAPPAILAAPHPANVAEADPREVRFALYSLWTRFGAPDPESSASVDEDGNADDDNDTETRSEVSATSGRSRTRSRASTEDGDASSRWCPNEALEFGTVRVTRYEFQNLGTRPCLGVRASFTVDPLGVTHVDLVHRMIDVTLLTLRQALMEAATRYMETRALDKAQNLVVAHVVESALLIKAHGKRLHVDWDTLKTTGLQNSKVAMFDEAAYDPVGGHLELFCSFARRQDVSDVVASQLWSASDVVQHFFRYEPRFADPRFVAEFLRRLVHPRTGAALFPEAAAMIQVRDRIMHHFHLIHAEEYSIGELYTDHGSMQCLIRKVCASLGVDPRMGRMAVLSAAMDDLEDLIGHYKRWRARQNAAFHQFAIAERLVLAQSTVKALLAAYDAETDTMDRGLRTDLAAEDGSGEALKYLLDLFGPIPEAGAEDDDDDAAEEDNLYNVLGGDDDHFSDGKGDEEADVDGESDDAGKTSKVPIKRTNE
ncbi:Hypothetical Protein FCC1311_009682 [Hondaea fermentalgiana]|uniref:Uncharacterized protein n=1 Tax=Hondaea fermentalgiana TaxID=2315210 RepID=A0A2R5G166_9STRA|nr:Hypothetical Protein FCC1311_009682 [Hondaea fermentalgiana]|eukprot:GBG24750.1 Hypothetical Protein FCC1311_009682 [Hondaea fermentalgiana]